MPPGETCFEKEFIIDAPDAEQANDKLQDMIDEVELNADVQNQGYHDFEDEPVECPTCGGDGILSGDTEKEGSLECPTCSGDGTVPFVA